MIETALQDNIILQVNNTNQKPIPSPQPYTTNCRICLQEMKEDEVFNVCQCKGSSAFVHEECQLEWIRKSNKHRDSFHTFYYICEICKARILLETVVKYRCINSKEVKDEICDKYICCTITTIIFLFCSLIVLGIIIYISSLASKNNPAQIIIYAIGLSITVLIIVITILVYVFNYTVKSQVIIIGIDKKHKQNKPNSNSTKIAPMQRLQNSLVPINLQGTLNELQH